MNDAVASAVNSIILVFPCVSAGEQRPATGRSTLEKAGVVILGRIHGNVRPSRPARDFFRDAVSVREEGNFRRIAFAFDFDIQVSIREWEAPAGREVLLPTGLPRNARAGRWTLTLAGSTEPLLVGRLLFGLLPVVARLLVVVLSLLMMLSDLLVMVNRLPMMVTGLLVMVRSLLAVMGRLFMPAVAVMVAG